MNADYENAVKALMAAVVATINAAIVAELLKNAPSLNTSLDNG